MRWCLAALLYIQCDYFLSAEMLSSQGMSELKLWYCLMKFALAKIKIKFLSRSGHLVALLSRRTPKSGDIFSEGFLIQLKGLSKLTYGGFQDEGMPLR